LICIRLDRDLGLLLFQFVLFDKLLLVGHNQIKRLEQFAYFYTFSVIYPQHLSEQSYKFVAEIILAHQVLELLLLFWIGGS
jgi:hypothetical protein